MKNLKYNMLLLIIDLKKQKNLKKNNQDSLNLYILTKINNIAAI